MALLDGKDGIRLGGSNRERPRDGSELLALNEAGVSHEAHVDAILVMTHDVLGAKAVPDGTNLGSAVSLLEGLDASHDDGVDGLGRVRVVAGAALADPRHEVDARIKFVAVENVGDQGCVAVGRKLVCDELRILPDAPDVGDQDNRGAGVDLVSRSLGEIGADAVAGDLDQLAGGSATREGRRYTSVNARSKTKCLVTDNEVWEG